MSRIALAAVAVPLRIRPVSPLCRDEAGLVGGYALRFCDSSLRTRAAGRGEARSDRTEHTHLNGLGIKQMHLSL
jgi:hypothetical protein